MKLDLESKLDRNVIVYIVLHKKDTLTKDHHAETSLKKRFFISSVHKYPALNCIHIPSLDQYFTYFARVFEGLQSYIGSPCL
jgi:hypothetical protein